MLLPLALLSCAVIGGQAGEAFAGVDTIPMPKCLVYGRKSLSPPLSMDQAIALVGRPDTIDSSLWRPVGTIIALEFRLEWETPVMMYRLDGLKVQFVRRGDWSNLCQTFGISFVSIGTKDAGGVLLRLPGSNAAGMPARL